MNCQLQKSVDVKVGWFESINGDNFLFPSHVRIEIFYCHAITPCKDPHTDFAAGY